MIKVIAVFGTRPEAVKAGTARVIGTETNNVYREISLLLSSEPAYQKMANAINPYGDGRASERIAQAILQYFHNNKK